MINVCERNTSRGCESESFVCVREMVVGKGSGSRSCVCVCEREREGGGVCLIGKQMNNVSFITGKETERRPQ